MEHDYRSRICRLQDYLGRELDAFVVSTQDSIYYLPVVHLRNPGLVY
jgi:hypothetical protein